VAGQGDEDSFHAAKNISAMDVKNAHARLFLRFLQDQRNGGVIFVLPMNHPAGAGGN
jgi:hypothetical protein